MKTLEYYNINAKAYFDKTIGADFAGMQQRFLGELPAGARVLDFGCGSGRDAVAFAKAGCSVKAIDGSEELCRLASEYAASEGTDVDVECLDFRDFAETDTYGGIWACASLLHLKREELPEIFRSLYAALKDDGILYTNFKYGDFDGERDGRYYTDITETGMETLREEAACFKDVNMWVTEDVLPGREGQKWLNVRMRKGDK